MAIVLKNQNITNMYTPIELVSTNIGQVAVMGGGGGITDHGYLHGLGDNDHPQYLLSSRSTQFMPAGNSASYQLTANNSLSLGTGAAASFLYTSNSSNLIALSNSSIYAVSNHTHTGLDGAVSDHIHGSILTASVSGTNVTVNSVSSGLTIGIPKYITTAYGAAIQGSGTYTQNTGTIQFANSNGVTFGLGTDGLMTASVPAVAGAQTGISAIAGSAASSVTNGTIQFVNANGISFGLNSNTMTASYTVPGNTVFSNSNNVEFGLSGSTVTALALFAQSTQTQNLFNLTLSGNTSGTMAQVSSGVLTLYGGSNVTLSQSGNKISINASAGVSNSHNVTLAGNSTSAGSGYIEISSGTLTLAGGDNITLSQNGNAITLIGPTVAGLQTGLSGFAGSNTTYTSGTVYLSGQNNITIGSYASSNSQYIRLSVGNYITTAMASDAGSNYISIGNSTAYATSVLSTKFLTTAALSQNTSNYAGLSTGSQSTNNTDIKFTLNTAGINLAIPKYVTIIPHELGVVAGQNIGVTLSLTNTTIIPNQYGLSLSVPASSNFVAASNTGNAYFGNSPTLTWGSSVSSNSTTFIATAAGGSGGTVTGGVALAFSGNTTGTTQIISSGTVQLVGGNNITLSQAGSIITISAGSVGGATNWVTATKTGSDIQISTGATNTLHYGKFITTYSAGTGMGSGLSKTLADMTVDSNGISFNGSRYAGTGFNSSTIAGSNVSGSLDSNGVRLWVPNYITNSYVFSNSNNVTWGTSGSTVTAAVPGVWPIAALGTGGGYVNKYNGAMTFSNSNNVSFGLNSNGDVMTASVSFPAGDIYFMNGNGFSFSSVIVGLSTSIYIYT